jgi:hypothetical protein
VFHSVANQQSLQGPGANLAKLFFFISGRAVILTGGGCLLGLLAAKPELFGRFASKKEIVL